MVGMSFLLMLISHVLFFSFVVQTRGQRKSSMQQGLEKLTVCVVMDGQTENLHIGYYWLAYGKWTMRACHQKSVQ